MAERVEDMLRRMGIDFGELTAGMEIVDHTTGKPTAPTDHVDLRRQVQSTIAPVANASVNDMPESGTEHIAIRRAVAEAVEHGIVREEVMSKGPREAFVLSSSHFGNDDRDPNTIPPDTKHSQVELFQLMHLLRVNKCKSPVFAEGRCYRMGCDTPFADLLHEEGMDLADPTVQQRLFEHPDALIALLDRHVAHRKQDPTLTAPSFYHFTSYPGIAGAHSFETEQQMQTMVEWTLWSVKLAEKYRPFVSQFVDPEGRPKAIPIQTGWDGDKAMLRLPMGWAYASEVERDCANYLKYVDMLEEFDVRRESELSDLMHATRPELTPLCFVGLGHTLRMVERLKDEFAVHILTPHSSTHLDKKRSAEPVNSPKNPLMNVDLYRTLLRLAQNVPPIRY